MHAAYKCGGDRPKPKIHGEHWWPILVPRDASASSLRSGCHRADLGSIHKS